MTILIGVALKIETASDMAKNILVQLLSKWLQLVYPDDVQLILVKIHAVAYK